MAVATPTESSTAADVWSRYSAFARAQPEIVFEWNDHFSPARGWLVINSLRGGAAGGGTRMHPGLSRERVTFLAKAMELKFALAGPPIGGAKSGIVFDPADPRKQEVLARWFRAIRPELLTRYGTAGDLNVSEIDEVIPHCKEIGVDHPQLGVLRGHFGLDGQALGRRSQLMLLGLDQPVPDEYGLVGKEARVFAMVTGYSVAASTRRLLECQNRDPAEVRVLLQGFGMVGGAAALYLARAGFRIVGIVDASSGVVDEEGLGPHDVEDLLLRRHGSTLPDMGNSAAAQAAREEFWNTPADIFVAAAGSGTLDAESLERLQRCGVCCIVAGANQPFAAAALGDTALQQEADHRFAVIADIIASCGTAHAFACQSCSDIPLHPHAVFESIRTTVDEGVDEAVRKAGGAARGLLAAVLELAMDRCERHPAETETDSE